MIIHPVLADDLHDRIATASEDELCWLAGTWAELAVRSTSDALCAFTGVICAMLHRPPHPVLIVELETAIDGLTDAEVEGLERAHAQIAAEERSRVAATIAQVLAGEDRDRARASRRPAP